MRYLVRISLSIFATSMIVIGNCQADDVIDTMNEAISSYKKGDLAQTKEDLVYVLELLKQKKGDSIKTVLPDALSGWKAEEAVVETAGSGMFGGGSTVSKKYTKGSSSVIISVVADSPLLQGLGSILGNPMFASGGKLKRIKRQKANIQYDPNRKTGEITIMLDKRFLITIKGDNVDEKILEEYAKKIDYDKIKSL